MHNFWVSSKFISPFYLKQQTTMWSSDFIYSQMHTVEIPGVGGNFAKTLGRRSMLLWKNLNILFFIKKLLLQFKKKIAGGSYVIHPYSTPCVHLGIYLTIEDLGKKISLTKDISLLLQSQILSLKLELKLKFSFEIQQKRWISWSTLFPRLTIRLWVTKNRKKTEAQNIDWLNNSSSGSRSSKMT